MPANNRLLHPGQFCEPFAQVHFTIVALQVRQSQVSAVDFAEEWEIVWRIEARRKSHYLLRFIDMPAIVIPPTQSHLFKEKDGGGQQTVRVLHAGIGEEYRLWFRLTNVPPYFLRFTIERSSGESTGEMASGFYMLRWQPCTADGIPAPPLPLVGTGDKSSAPLPGERQTDGDEACLPRLERAFDEMARAVCRLLAGHPWPRTHLQNTSWQREMAAVANLHRLSLAGMKEGYTNAGRLQRAVIDYLWRMWRACEGETSGSAAAFHAAWQNYRDVSNAALPAFSRDAGLWLAPCLVPHHPGPCRVLSQLCDQLAHGSKRMRELLATSAYKKAAPAATLVSSLTQLSDTAGRHKRRLAVFPQTGPCDLAAAVGEILLALQKVQEAALPFLVLDASNRVAEEIDRLWQILRATYPEMAEMESENACERSCFYLSPWPGRQASTFCTYRKESLGLRVRRTRCQPLFLADSHEQAALRQLVVIYLATGDDVLYRILLAPLGEIAPPAGESASLAGTVVAGEYADDTLGHIALAFCHYWQERAGVDSGLADLAPLCACLGIDIVSEHNWRQWREDGDIVEHVYRFAAPAGDFVQQPGCRRGNLVWQKAQVAHRVWPRPACIDSLSRVLNHLESMPLDSHAACQALNELLTPVFWHHACDQADFVEARLLPALAAFVNAADTAIYRRHESCGKAQRCLYEDLLASVVGDLRHDGYIIALPAGVYNGLGEGPLPPRRLAERSLEAWVATDYPLPHPEFRRPLATAGDFPATGHFFYCRGFMPETAAVLTTCLPAGSDNQAVAEILARIDAEWPQGKQTLAQAIVDSVVSPHNQRLLATSGESEPAAGYSWLQRLYAAMRCDGMPLFAPPPDVVGMHREKLTPASDYQVVEKFHHFQPHGHVIAIGRFSFVPPYTVQVSAGSKPILLDLFHATMEALWQWVRESPWVLSAGCRMIDSGEFLGYAATVTAAHHVKEDFYPHCTAGDFDLAALHRAILNRPAGQQTSVTTATLDGMLRLLQWLDTVSTFWYPAGGALAEKAREMASALASHVQTRGGVVPVSLAESVPDTRFLHFMCDSSANLRIRRRRLPGQNEQVVVLRGNPSSGGDLCYRDTGLLDELRRLFIEQWSFWRCLADVLVREEASKAWEQAYYLVHQSGRKESVLGVFDVFYRYGEHIERIVGYDGFLEWEGRLRFLETWLKQQHDISRVTVNRGENMYARQELIDHFAFVPKKTGDLTFASQSVIRVSKPAFVKGNTRIQRGTLEVYQ